MAEIPMTGHSDDRGVWFFVRLTRYRAAVAYLDWMVGNVLDALERSGAAGKTVTVFMGDHGYQLGEHNLWCKMTVFELGTRVPFMIRVPGSASQAGDRYCPRLARLPT
jgi:arylsulfatase A-like enzyme